MKGFKFIIFTLLILTCNEVRAFDAGHYQKSEITGCFEASEVPHVDQIVTNDQGVFLLVNDFWVYSQGLQASREGMFVLINREWMPLLALIESSDCIQASWKHSKYGRYTMDGVNTCPYCGKSESD